MSAAVLVKLRIEKILRAYREAGALDPATARRPEDLGIASRLIFARLVKEGALVHSEDGRYYLDPIAVERYHRRRRTRIWAFVGAALLILVIYLLVMHG